MQKFKIKGYVVLCILLVLMSIVAFVPPLAKNTVFWMGYLFSIIAILAQVYFFKSSFERDKTVKSKFYGFPIARVGIIYLSVQVAVSLVEMVMGPLIPSLIAVVLNAFILAFAIIGCFAAETVRDEIERQDAVLKTNVTNMRVMQSMAVSLVGLASSEAMKKDLQRVADEFMYSDPVTSMGTAEIEHELDRQLKEIQAAVLESDIEGTKRLCNMVMTALGERNRLCRLGK